MGDDLQAISQMMSVAWSCLKGQELKGYRIYWMEKGDLDYFDFWSYQPEPTKFAPPSAIQRAASDAAFPKESDRLMPSFRIGVKEDDLMIVTYKVLPDEGDTLNYVIDRERSLALGPDETARLLGRMLLQDIPGGRKILGLD
jgi:hypothetical protein